MPSLSAVTVTSLPSLNTSLSSTIILTVENASAVPFRVGKLSFVRAFLTLPTTPPATSSMISVITGCVVLISTFTVATFDGLLTLPALSVAIATTLYSPSASGDFGVNSQLPFASAFTMMSLLIMSLPFLRTIVEPASAVPLNVGVVSFVKPSFTPSIFPPFSTPPHQLSVAAVMTGASI